LSTLPLGQADVPPPVRLHVMGEDAWRDFETWPPPGYYTRRFHLQPDAALSIELPGESEPDTYRYDSADPTPSVGGALLRSAVVVASKTPSWRPGRTC
jgi:predicted acyl esterase